MTERTLSTQAKTFLSNLQDGAWQPPIGLKNLGIRPDLWLKEFDYGYTRYEWPNTGDRDISENRAFGGWVAGFSDHIVSITMASALAEGEWFTTMELQTRILRPVGHGLITIEGRLVSRDRTTGLVEAEWKDTNGRLLAKITAAKAIRTRDELGQPAISK